MATPFLDPGEEMASVGRLLPARIHFAGHFHGLNVAPGLQAPAGRRRFLSTMAVAERLEIGGGERESQGEEKGDEHGFS